MWTGLNYRLLYLLLYGSKVSCTVPGCTETLARKNELDRHLRVVHQRYVIFTFITRYDTHQFSEIRHFTFVLCPVAQRDGQDNKFQI